MRLVSIATLLIVTMACGGAKTPEPQGSAPPASQAEVTWSSADTGGHDARRYRRDPAGGSEQVQQDAGLFPLCRSELSRARLFRGRTRAHRLVGGRGRHRNDARPRGGGAVRSRGRSGVDQRSAREARQTARLGRRNGSLRRHGRHHRDQGWQCRDDAGRHHQAVARPVRQGRPGCQVGRHGTDRRPVHQEAAAADHGPEVRQGRLGQEHRDPGEVQRARPVHGVHRLRVDVQRRRRRQPASQRDLPGWQSEGRAGPADDDIPERKPRGTVEVDGGLGAEDRRQAARDSAQRQLVQRPHVPADHLRG